MKGLPCGDSGSEMNRLAATSASAFRLAAAIAEILVRPSVCRRALWPENSAPQLLEFGSARRFGANEVSFQSWWEFEVVSRGRQAESLRGVRGIVENLHSGGRRRAVHAQ